MKKLIFVAVCLSISIPSFGAEHLVNRSAAVAGKESYNPTKVSAHDIGDAGRPILKTVF